MGTALPINHLQVTQSFATSNFGSATDEEMLRARGPDEEQIRMLWTPRSLIVARLALFVPYSLMIVALVAAFSFGVAGDILKTRDTRKHP